MSKLKIDDFFIVSNFGPAGKEITEVEIAIVKENDQKFFLKLCTIDMHCRSIVIHETAEDFDFAVKVPKGVCLRFS